MKKHITKQTRSLSPDGIENIVLEQIVESAIACVDFWGEYVEDASYDCHCHLLEDGIEIRVSDDLAAREHVLIMANSEIVFDVSWVCCTKDLEVNTFEEGPWIDILLSNAQS